MIVVFTTFNRWLPRKNMVNGHHLALTAEWINRRFAVWRRYTWVSILRQRYKNWVYVVYCHPFSRTITSACFGTIRDPRLIVDYSYPNPNARLRGMIHGSILTTRIDSDDMYHPDAFAELVKSIDKHEFYSWRRGYICNYMTKELRVYDKRSTTPFFAHKHAKHNGLIQEPRHHDVAKYAPKHLPGRRFVVGINSGMNLSTHMGMGKAPIVGARKEMVKKIYPML